MLVCSLSQFENLIMDLLTDLPIYFLFSWVRFLILFEIFLKWFEIFQDAVIPSGMRWIFLPHFKI